RRTPCRTVVAGLGSHRKLEHRARFALSGNSQVLADDSGRPDPAAGGGPERAADAVSRHRERACTGPRCERCFRHGVPGTQRGFTRFARVSWSGDAVSMAALEWEN